MAVRETVAVSIGVVAVPVKVLMTALVTAAAEAGFVSPVTVQETALVFRSVPVTVI